MRAFGYVRVSSEEQCREGVSLGMQLEKIRAYCSLNDLDLVEVVSDAGISAKNINGRPGFRRVLDMIFKGNADGLIVWKLDRAFRSTQDALSVAETLNKRGKALISISEKLDTSSAVGEFFFTLMASLAQMERKLIGERTSAALQSKKARGERVGEIPFGYRLADDGIHLIEDDDEQEIITKLSCLRNMGRSYRQIASEFNLQGLLTKKGKTWTHVQVSDIWSRVA